MLPCQTRLALSLLNPSLTSIDGSQVLQNLSAPSPPDLKDLSASITFKGWRIANANFKSWAKKMASLHGPIWRKAGIFEAVMASTYRICRDTDLVLGIAEKWCPETKNFVFSWGETTITLEDVTVLLGFSVLGLPVFATLDSSGENVKAILEKEWLEIRKCTAFYVSQVSWMNKFVNKGGDIEHVAFLALWLSYFVFPSQYYQLYDAMFPIAIHLSRGTRIALAPAVLAHLYAELSLLKTHIRAFKESMATNKAELSALFKLVQVWTWERFKKIQPKPNPLQKGEQRLALWQNLKQTITSEAWQVMDNWKLDSFEWRPYTKTVKGWKFPKFYPEKETWVPACQSLDDEFITFARFIKVSELAGINNVEHYFPDRVASQFGLIQDVPCFANRNNVSKMAAWKDYNKPVDDLTLYIPSRTKIPCVTPMFCEWWWNSFPRLKDSLEENQVVESAETTTMGYDDNSFVPTGSGMKIAEVLRLEYIKRAGENNESTYNGEHAEVNEVLEEGEGGNEEINVDIREEDTGVAQEMDTNDKVVEEDTSVTLNNKKKRTREMIEEEHGGDEDKEGENGPKMNKTIMDGMEITEDIRWRLKYRKRDRKNMVVSPYDNNNSSNLIFGADGVSSMPETMLTCDDELEVHGRNADIIDDGRKEPNWLLQEDGVIIGEKRISDENLCSEAEKEDDDSLTQNFFAVGDLVLIPSDELNIHNAVGEGNQGKACLLHENGLANEETVKSNEQYCEESEKRNSAFDKDNSTVKRFQELKVMASLMEERINKLGRNWAWLKERKAIIQRKVAAPRLI